MLRDDFDLHRYKTILCKLDGSYAPIETAFSKLPDLSKWNQEYNDRKKIRLLEEDLEFFLISRPEFQTLAQKPLWFERLSRAV